MNVSITCLRFKGRKKECGILFIMISLSFSFLAQLCCSETGCRRTTSPSPTDTKTMQLRWIYGKEI